MKEQLNTKDHLWHMKIALEEAEKAFKIGEVPIGSVLVGPDGQVVAKAHNLKETHHRPTAHAEILCMEEAAQALQNWRLLECTLYVTLEPCPMCLAAMVQSRISHLVFGAYDPKGGALSLNYNLYKDPRLNHRFKVMGGVLHYPCSRLLSQFFKQRRQEFQNKKG